MLKYSFFALFIFAFSFSLKNYQYDSMTGRSLSSVPTGDNACIDLIKAYFPKDDSKVLGAFQKGVKDSIHQYYDLNTLGEKDPKKLKAVLKIVQEYDQKPSWDRYDVENFISLIHNKMIPGESTLKVLKQSAKQRDEALDLYFKQVIEKRLMEKSMFESLKEMNLVTEPKVKKLLQVRLKRMYKKITPVLIGLFDTNSLLGLSTAIYIPEINLLKSESFQEMILKRLEEDGVDNTMIFLKSKFENKAILHIYSKALSRLNKYFIASTISIAVYDAYSDKFSDDSQKSDPKEDNAEFSDKDVNAQLENL